MLIQIFPWKNYFQWGAGIIWNMQLYFLPIGVYGKSGMHEWLWKCTKSSDSMRDHMLSESKVLGLSFTCYKWFLDIGTMTIQSVPHPYCVPSSPWRRIHQADPVLSIDHSHNIIDYMVSTFSFGWFTLRTLTNNTWFNLSQRLVIWLWTFWRRFDHGVSQILVIPWPKVGHIGHSD